MATGTPTPEEFFSGSPRGLAIFGAIADVVGSFGQVEIRVSKSQIAFRRRRAFAYVWRPDRYVQSEVPAVISIALDHQLNSSRFKEVISPSPKVWMHHMELWQTVQVNDELRQWLRQAYESAA